MDVLEARTLWMIGDTTKQDKKRREYVVRELKYQLVAEEMLLGCKVIGFYFGSSSFCRHFTNELKEFYLSARKNHHLYFQIIYVSCDYDAAEMQGAIKCHPDWVAVKYDDPLRLLLKKKFNVSDSHRLPKLVVVEINGRVITEQGRWEVFVAGESAIEMWLKGQPAVPRWNIESCCLKRNNSQICMVM